MLGDYGQFKKSIYNLTQIDLSAYKENQMRRRIDTLIAKNNVLSYETYVDLLKKEIGIDAESIVERIKKEMEN